MTDLISDFFRARWCNFFHRDKYIKVYATVAVCQKCGTQYEVIG